jgi:2-phosphoglycolate phosphatase
MTEVRTVLFDLDGTLADTAPDLGDALNRMLVNAHRAALPQGTIRPEASHGTTGLLRLGFGIGPDDPRFEPLRRQFLELYQERLYVHTRLFPGVDALLAGLYTRGLRWGIVTNKPGFLTEPLVERLGLLNAAVCVVSGDTTTNRKPHPEPLLHACTLAGCTPPQCLYVGDAERDIQAGRAAGMLTLAARFGYIRAHENPLEWGADGTIDAPLEILDWLDAHG